MSARSVKMRVYNLAIADSRTYYVLAGKTSILVHNTCARVELDLESEIYVKSKHMAGGKLLNENKGVFDEGQDLEKLVEEANSCACSGPNKNGNFERNVNAGRVIGVTGKPSGALPTTWYKVVQDKHGNVITMYPISAPSTN